MNNIFEILSLRQQAMNTFVLGQRGLNGVWIGIGIHPPYSRYYTHHQKI